MISMGVVERPLLKPGSRMNRSAVLLFAASLFAAPALAAAPPAQAASPTKPAPLPPSPFGIAGLKPRYGRDLPELWDVVAELGNYMEDAGIRWDRAEIVWGDVQSAPGQWDWSFTDKMVEVYRKRPIAAYCLLEDKAPWMTAPPHTDEDRRQYGEFVFNVVNRYKGTIRAWEIWNEENIPSFWKEPSAEDYAALLKTAYEAAKRADPGCTIITGGTSTVDLGFIRRVLYDHGGWDHCDAMAIHPYSMGGSPASQGLAETLRMTKAAITKNGVQKPLWITEVGWTTDTTPESERRQAEFLVQEYTVSLAENVRKIFWFTLGDWAERWGIIAGKKNIPDWGYTSTRRAKPAFYALKHLTDALSPTGKRPMFLGYLPSKENVTAMAFLGDGDSRQPVLVLWAPHGEIRTVSLGQKAGLRALNAHGKSVEIVEGRILATEVPVLVTGHKPGALKAAAPKNDPTIRRPGVNLLINPSMEFAEGTDVSFWSPGRFPDESKQATLTWLPAGRSGKHALGMINARDGAWHSVPVPVWAGKTYTLSAWVKPTAATGENRAVLMWYSGNMWTWLSQEVTESVAGDGDWRQVTVKGVAPKDAVIARITLISKDNTGSVAWDDVMLTEG